MKDLTKVKKLVLLTILPGIVFLSEVFAQTVQNTQGGGFLNQNTQYNPNVPGSTEGLKNDSLLVAVKKFVNWVLSLLALIALGVLLWGGFQMVTAAGDDNKYKKGFTILKQAGIGLVLIGLAWLIVSLFFYIVGIMTGA